MNGIIIVVNTKYNTIHTHTKLEYENITLKIDTM